jgi:hypothetical protein
MTQFLVSLFSATEVITGNPNFAALMSNGGLPMRTGSGVSIGSVILRILASRNTDCFLPCKAAPEIEENRDCG